MRMRVRAYVRTQARVYVVCVRARVHVVVPRVRVCSHVCLSSIMRAWIDWIRLLARKILLHIDVNTTSVRCTDTNDVYKAPIRRTHNAMKICVIFMFWHTRQLT